MSFEKYVFAILPIFLLSACNDSPEFKFENFRDSEKLKIYLSEKFPKKSNVSFLLTEIESAQATCKFGKSAPHIIEISDDYYFCHYIQTKFLGSPTRWFVSILVDKDKIEKIDVFTVVVSP